MRHKVCKICGIKFQPERQFQKCCSISCAISLANKAKERQHKKERQEFKRKVQLNDKKRQTQLAQTAFNRFIRLRDALEPCISCGTRNNVQYAAGHYRSVGAMPSLRWCEMNVHKQCNHHCNQMLSGNIANFRIGLIKKIGLESVEWLEGEHKPKKYTIEEIISIKEKYKAKCKKLEMEAA